MVPGMAGGVEDCVVIVEQSVGEVALTQVEPEPLDWVELRGIWRQWQQGDVVGDAQRLGAVPAGLIKHHESMLVGSKLLAERGEKQVHRLGADLGHHQSEAPPARRMDSSEDMHPGVAPITQTRRTLATTPPAMAHAALLADPRLVLEPKGQAFAGMRLSGQVGRRQEAPF